MKLNLSILRVICFLSTAVFFSGVHAQANPISALGSSLQNLGHSLSSLAHGGPAKSAGAWNQAASVPWNPEIQWPATGRRQAEASFNEALPVIKATLSILACIPYSKTYTDNLGVEEEAGWRALLPYDVDHGNVRMNGEAYGTPMAQMQYHDQQACLAIKSLDVDMPARNAISANVLYVAADSGETTSYRYTYLKTYDGEWRFAHYEKSN